MPVVTNQFFGQMDQDSDPRYVAPGDYISATNADNSLSGVFQALRGTTEVVNANLPTGTNTVIHSLEDKSNGCLYYFVHNSLNNHSIWKYSSITNKIQEVCRGSILDFTLERKISAAFILRGKDLYWTDARSYGGEITGTHPKHIDTERAIIDGKNLSYAIYAGNPGEGQFENNAQYTISVLDLNGAALETVVFTSDGTYLNDPIGGLQWLKSQIEASTLNNDVLLEICNCDLKITMALAGRRLQVSDGNADLFTTEINHYPPILRIEHLDWIRRPAVVAPTTQYIGDPENDFNAVERGCFQFRVRYNYFGGQPSAWGPISNVALNLDVSTGEVIPGLNAILVDFSDPFILFENGGLDMIESVDLAVRDGNDAPFRLVETIPACKVGVARSTYIFRNDKHYPVIPSDDPSSSVGGAQVLKPFDYFPVLAASAGVVSDGDGQARVFLGNIQDLYSCDDCVEGRVEPVEATAEGLFSIIGKVRVVNNDLSETNSSKGYVVYLAGHPLWARTDTDGNFEIKNVSRGRYILRVASRHCRFDNTITPVLNLNNGLGWQSTSAPTIDVANSVAAGNGRAERILDLTFQSGNLDLQIAAGYGDILIRGANNDVPPFDVVIEAYYVDNFGLLTGDAVGVERHAVSFGGTIVTTDHNGHAFVVLPSATAPITLITVPSNINISNSLSPIPGDDYLIAQLTNTSAGWAATHRKKISGVAKSDSGIGIGGAVITLQRGKWGVSASDGTYEFPFFSVDPTGNRTGDELWSTYRNDIQYLFPPDPLSVTPSLSPISDYVFNHEYPFLFGMAGSQSRALKHSGSYLVGVVYEDRANRTCGAVKIGTLRVPGVAEWGSIAKLSGRWFLDSQPPLWATHFRIVRSRDGVHRDFTYYSPNEIKYVRLFNLKDPPIATTFAAGNATHLMIRVNPTLDKTDGDVVTLFHQENKEGYFPEVGNRMRWLLTHLGETVTNKTIEVEVLGHHIDGADFYVLVELPDVSTEMLPGALVEFFSPNIVQDGIYYEFGQRLRVIDPGLPTRRHQGQILGAQPASGVMDTGDTFQRFRIFDDGAAGYYHQKVETYTKDDFSMDRCEDIGRAFLLVKPEETTHRPNMVRWSEGFSAAHGVDSSNSFGAFDFGSINPEFGHIMWLGQVHASMLVVCQNKSQPVYVGKGELLSLDGSTSLGRSQQIFNVANETVHDYGTHHPASIIVEDGVLYAWDAFRGVPWVFGGDGSSDIYGKMTTFFRQKGRERWPILRAEDDVFAGFDRERNQYFLSFRGGTFAGAEGASVTVPGTAIVFDKGKRGWTYFTTMLPSAYGRIANRLYVFSNGKIYKAFESFVYNNFFAAQGNANVKFAVNPESHLIKLWQAFSFRARTKWRLTDILGNPGVDYIRQQSNVPTAYIRGIENAWNGSFLRDKKDMAKEFEAIANQTNREAAAILRGRKLRGEWLEITMEPVVAATQTSLGSFSTEFVLSEKTI